MNFHMCLPDVFAGDCYGSSFFPHRRQNFAALGFPPPQAGQTRSAAPRFDLPETEIASAAMITTITTKPRNKTASISIAMICNYAVRPGPTASICVAYPAWIKWDNRNCGEVDNRCHVDGHLSSALFQGRDARDDHAEIE
jgi:hypothetical protein